MVECVVIFIIGLILGVAISKFIFKPKYAGILRLYKELPDEPVSLYLELEESPDKLLDSEYVTFKVKEVDIR